MKPTRYTVERDVARFALAVPEAAVEAWNTGEIFQGHVTDDVLAASLAACVVFISKPQSDHTETNLIRLMTAALRDADAWHNHRSDELDWYAATWGPREVGWAVSEGFIGFGGFDQRLWLSALQAFFPYAREAA